MQNSYPKRWYGLIVLSIILTIISIDSSVLDVALPSISSSLDASAKDLQWLIDIYILLFASLLLSLGAFGDRYGRRVLLQIGLFVFGMASLGAIFSTTMNELIFYRGLTGLGAAMMMPSTLSIITDMFRDKEERTKAISIWGMTFGIGFSVGPLLGGLIVDHYGWEGVFFINVPIVIIAIITSILWLPESSDESSSKVDIIGMILSVIGLFLLVFGIIEAGMLGWSSSEVLNYFYSSFVVIILFLYWEHKSTHPMLPLELFHNRSFWVSSIALTLIMFGMMGTMFFFSQFFQTVQDYSATEAGLLLLPLTIGIMISGVITPKLLKKFSFKFVVTNGIIIAGMGLVYFASLIDITTSKYIIMIGFLIQGLGFGLAMIPATDMIMASIPPQKLGVGSAMNDTTRELGGALSIAVLGSLVNNSYIQSIQNSTIAEGLKDSISLSIQSAHIIATNLHNDTIIFIANRAFVDGLSYAMYIGAVVTFVSAIITYKYLPSQNISKF